MTDGRRLAPDGAAPAHRLPRRVGHRRSGCSSSAPSSPTCSPGPGTGRPSTPAGSSWQPVVAVLTAVVASIVVTRRMVAPMEVALATARAFAAGDHTVRVPDLGRPELAELVDALERRRQRGRAVRAGPSASHRGHRPRAADPAHRAPGRSRGAARRPGPAHSRHVGRPPRPGDPARPGGQRPRRALRRGVPGAAARSRPRRPRGGVGGRARGPRLGAVRRGPDVACRSRVRGRRARRRRPPPPGRGQPARELHGLLPPRRHRGRARARGRRPRRAGGGRQRPGPHRRGVPQGLRPRAGGVGRPEGHRAPAWACRSSARSSSPRAGGSSSPPRWVPAPR